MSYTKTNWVNDQAPAINATNLNKIENGIFNNDNNISSINGTLGVDTNTWVGTTAYGEGDIVIYNDKIYQNISGTSTTTNPAEDTTNWDEITIFDTDSINDDLIDKTKFIKNTNTNSAVNSYSCNYLNNSDSYSTSEVKTNKRWIDGKPIYRKVFQLDITATDTWLTAPNSIISNYQTATYMGGIYGGYSPIPVYVNDSYSIAIQYNSSAGVQAYSKGFGSGGMYIIVEYTKTTD